MSENKHTPGPWTADYVPAASQHIINAQKEMVARVNYVGRFTVDEIEANARLIAAAPGLLEACEAALQKLDDLSKLSGIYAACGPASILRAAIAKAKGETT